MFSTKPIGIKLPSCIQIFSNYHSCCLCSPVCHHLPFIHAYAVQGVIIYPSSLLKQSSVVIYPSYMFMQSRVSSYTLHACLSSPGSSYTLHTCLCSPGCHHIPFMPA
ncbi:hypothetical protein CHS0354_016079 [Potamilus streckersoni]|uniref:Uncharacterized protein n=1 Tax=Potamilus streckersoni TaxID=2493646 RepID=A0AAE0T103_9BIVA|nr:hypothetical protein CHS0354_016079 [Potamilus streckersoni]